MTFSRDPSQIYFYRVPCSERARDKYVSASRLRPNESGQCRFCVRRVSFDSGSGRCWRTPKECWHLAVPSATVRPSMSVRSWSRRCRRTLLLPQRRSHVTFLVAATAAGLYLLLVVIILIIHSLLYLLYKLQTVVLLNIVWLKYYILLSRATENVTFVGSPTG